ncbi:hypothetical protein PLESTM_001596900, partial [Pleodorina starrii]
RVRMGLHSGLKDPHAISTNKASGRTQYGGSFLTISKRTSDAANGGQICLTDETYRQLPSRSLLHRAWVLQMGHHHLGECVPRASPSAVPSPLAGGEEEEDAEYQLYQVVGYDLAVRLALLPPLRSPACLIRGCLSAPVGGLAIAFMYVHALQSLMSWNSEITMEAVETFHRVASYRCKEHDGYVSEGQEGLVLAAFRDPAQALMWALTTQQALIHQSWDPELLEHELAEEVAVLVPAGELAVGEHTHPVGAAAGTPSPLPTQVLTSAQLGENAALITGTLAPLAAEAAAAAPATSGEGGGGPGAPRSGGGGAAAAEAPLSMVMSMGAAVADMYGMYDDEEVPPGMVRKVLMRGLRMRVGIDVGRLNESISPTSSAVVYRGKAMNRAARIGALASSSQILCSSAAWRAAAASPAVDVAGRIHAASLGRHVLRGVAEPIEVFHCKLRAPDPAAAAAAVPPPRDDAVTEALPPPLRLPHLALLSELTLAGASGVSSGGAGAGATRPGSSRPVRRESELLNLLPPGMAPPPPLPPALRQQLHSQSQSQPASQRLSPLQYGPPRPPAAALDSTVSAPLMPLPSATAPAEAAVAAAAAAAAASSEDGGGGGGSTTALLAAAGPGALLRTAAAAEFEAAADAAARAATDNSDAAAAMRSHRAAPALRPLSRATLRADAAGPAQRGSSTAATATAATLPIASPTAATEDGNAAAFAAAAGLASGTTSHSIVIAGALEDTQRSAHLASCLMLTNPLAAAGAAADGSGGAALASGGYVITPYSDLTARDGEADGPAGAATSRFLRSSNADMAASGGTAGAIVSADGNRVLGSAGRRPHVTPRMALHSATSFLLRDLLPPAPRVGGGAATPAAADPASAPYGGGGGFGSRAGRAATSSSGQKGISSGALSLKEGLAAVAATLMNLGGGGSHTHSHGNPQSPTLGLAAAQPQSLPLSGQAAEAVALRRMRRRSVIHTRAAAAVDPGVSSGGGLGGLGLSGRALASSTSISRALRMGPMGRSASHR